jgi:hypothetical protein
MAVGRPARSFPSDHESRVKEDGIGAMLVSEAFGATALKLRPDISVHEYDRFMKKFCLSAVHRGRGRGAQARGLSRRDHEGKQ